MPKRCGDALCAKLVNERKSHIRFADKVFCDEDCRQAWAAQNEVFDTAADRFHAPMHHPPRRMNGN